jgi:hypothetical protein
MAPAGYRFDIFLSYSRAESWPIFVDGHFLPILRHWVGAELGREVDVFVDTHEIGIGQRWPDELEMALAASRVMVSLWSRNYFYSDWCQRELAAILARADALRDRSFPGDIIFPFAIHDCSDADIPDCVSQLQRTAIHEWADPFMHRRGGRRERLSSALKSAAPAVAAGVTASSPAGFAWPLPDYAEFLDRLRSPRRPLVPVPSLGDDR